MTSKTTQIEHLQLAIHDLRGTLTAAHDQNHEQRKTIRSLQEEVFALRKGVTTSFDVVTISRTGTRDNRIFTDKVDALHWATDQRISAKFDRVVIFEIEKRRQALYPDGRVIAPFSN